MMKQYVFAGFGGQGMLLIGKFLAMANMLEGKHVSWLPSAVRPTAPSSSPTSRSAPRWWITAMS